jgi:peptidoglycan/LPS O-acetylase OafA/YrhL
MADQPTESGGEPERAIRAGTRRLLYWAAGLSIGALVAHAIDAPDHITEWWGYAAFFVTAGAFQFFYGFGLLLQPWRYDDAGDERSDGERHGRPYYMLGLILTASIIVIYIVTRTTGMPFFGPGAAAEVVTPLNLLPIIEDVPLVYCLARLYVASGSRYRTKPSF